MQPNGAQSEREQRIRQRQVAYGVISAATLTANGVGKTQRQRLVASGDLTRIRRGWYTGRSHDESVAAAVRIGGRLTCTSVLERHGIWMPRPPAVHARIAPGASRPATKDLTVHRLIDVPLGEDPVDDVTTSLRSAFTCLEPIDALIVADSVVNKRVLSNSEVLELAKGAPKAVRRILRYLDGRSQSGTETIVRYHLQRRKYRLRPQPQISGVGHVDHLVGDRLIIECDSTAFHTRDENHAEDRRRDLEAVRRGYLVIRLTFAQVRHDWDATWRLIEQVLAHRSHRWTSRTRKMAESASVAWSDRWVDAWHDDHLPTDEELEQLLASDPLLAD